MDAGMGYYSSDQFLTYVMRLAQHQSKPEKLMVATYPGIWISEDFGSTWNFKFDLLYSYNEHQFLGWHPTKDNVLFYTSESEALAAQILRSENGGNDWGIINPDPNGDNSCHNLAFDPDNDDHILYSGEGCIFESNDCGKTWHCVYRHPVSHHPYYRGMTSPHTKARTAFCAGLDNQPASYANRQRACLPRPGAGAMPPGILLSSRLRFCPETLLSPPLFHPTACTGEIGRAHV